MIHTLAKCAVKYSSYLEIVPAKGVVNAAIGLLQREKTLSFFDE
jgi:hypothetical protein